jgi:hypothetical protein
LQGKCKVYLLGKTPLSKKAHEKTHVHRARFDGRPRLPGWPGKRWRSPEPGRAVAFIEGEGKEVSTGAGVSGRGGAVLEHGNLFKGGLPYWMIHKMATLPFHH